MKTEGILFFLSETLLLFFVCLFFFCFFMGIKFCLSSRKANLSLDKDKSSGANYILFCGVHFCFHLEMAACILFSSHVVDLMP